MISHSDRGRRFGVVQVRHAAIGRDPGLSQGVVPADYRQAHVPRRPQSAQRYKKQWVSCFRN